MYYKFGIFIHFCIFIFVNQIYKYIHKVVFKDYSQGQIILFPARLDEKIPVDSPTRLINQVVDNFDISSIIESYKGGGSSSYHPSMMLKVVLFAYLNNVYSCRKIEKCLTENMAFRQSNP
ncbi:hypothetical protein EZS27_037584 [termite gut metagenome]|uniref:Transposase InsH N-terminal domain-containing protein n=1 Tax=termite gut metagenome TaxID=433724 RepID=A0A5J4PR25_9ZZZZ